MATKKTAVQKKSAPPKKKSSKKASHQPVTEERVTEYDHYVASYNSYVNTKEMRKHYWSLAVAYFKGWLNTFR